MFGTPSPRDLWLRLADLERCCLVKLESSTESGGLRWRCTITRQDGTGTPITAEADSALAVLCEAVEQADERGWIRL